MHFRTLSFLFTLLAFVLLAHAWTKEDHEIFRLRDELESHEGTDVTFYDFLGIKPSANIDEINKAFKQKSRTLHPDKAKHAFIASKSTRAPRKAGDKKKQKPGVHVSKGPSQREVDKIVKAASERYSRLGVVANVLRGPERERYDHFLRHGFPNWRGTGYYYTRYRPGLGTVIVGLFLAGGGLAHYYALKISYKSQREFMERTIRQARKQAWGDESGIQGIPGVNASGTSSGVQAASTSAEPEEPDQYANLNRRQKREMEKQNKRDKNKSKSGAGRGTGTGTSTPTTTAAVGGEPTSAASPQGEKRRVMSENGKVFIVDSVGNVFLEAEDEDGLTQEFLLNVEEIPKPTVRDTAVFRFPIWLYRKAFDPFLKDTKPIPDDAISISETEKVIRDDSPDLSSTPTPDMSASQEFEMVDSTGSIEREIAGAVSSAAAKKRGKKGRK